VIYQQLKDKNFEIVSVAQDTNGVKDAGPWITAAHPTYTVLIDEQHLEHALKAPERGRESRPHQQHLEIGTERGKRGSRSEYCQRHDSYSILASDENTKGEQAPRRLPFFQTLLCC